MKSTYKLIGVFWDRKPATCRFEIINSFDSSYLELGMQFCLLDIKEKKRCINLTSLLSVDKAEDFDAILKHLKECSSIAILIDYVPQTPSFTQWQFFLHRLYQIVGALNACLPEAEIFFMPPPAVRAH